MYTNNIDIYNFDDSASTEEDVTSIEKRAKIASRIAGRIHRKFEKKQYSVAVRAGRLGLFNKTFGIEIARPNPVREDLTSEDLVDVISLRTLKGQPRDLANDPREHPGDFLHDGASYFAPPPLGPFEVTRIYPPATEQLVY